MAARTLSLPPLYAILDPEQIRGRRAEDVLRELISGGATLLQLRAKAMAPREFLELARQARQFTRTRGCRLIVNDRVDVALACGADGVHLGQEDLPLHAARNLLPGKIIGVSTHDLEQAKAAQAGGADYIGFGPIYGTATKQTGYSARGVELLREIRDSVDIPIVAIGGISENNVTQIWQAGADSAAIISDILSADDIAAKVRRILNYQRSLTTGGKPMIGNFSTAPEDRYFEDYVTGSVHEFGPIGVSEEEILDFGKRFVPLSYHIDKDAAKNSIYGGLIASGWHTAALMMRLYTDNYLSKVANLGSPGVDELRWDKPVFPGDELSIRVTVLDARGSASKPDRGILRSFIEVLNQKHEVVMHLKSVNFVRRRQSAAVSLPV